MKKLTALLTTAVMIFLLAFSVTPVRAEEQQIDWNNVDWENFSWGDIDEGDNWETLSAWLRTEADFEELFYIDTHCGHAAYSDTVSAIMRERFEADPQAMLESLASVDAETRCWHVGSIVYGWYDWDGMVKTLESIRLTGDDTAAAYAVLDELIAYAEQETGRTITNPKTGDFSEGIAALFVFCAGGIITMVYWKREF